MMLLPITGGANSKIYRQHPGLSVNEFFAFIHCQVIYKEQRTGSTGSLPWQRSLWALGVALQRCPYPPHKQGDCITSVMPTHNHCLPTVVWVYCPPRRVVNIRPATSGKHNPTMGGKHDPTIDTIPEP